ncbi:unnamed protein product, partial [Cyprideis torosa]
MAGMIHGTRTAMLVGIISMGISVIIGIFLGALAGYYGDRVAVVKNPSIMIVMIIIGFTSWTGIAKYTRAELLKVRSLEYIQAAQSLGYSMRPEDVTWGSMLSTARDNFSAWWLAIIPGFAIFITVTLFNLLGEGLNDAMDPKLRQ